MTNNEIKKALYKEKPMAEKLYNQDNSVIYGCDTSLGRVIFRIPENESAKFNQEEPAQLLIRWMVQDIK